MSSAAVAPLGGARWNRGAVPRLLVRTSGVLLPLAVGLLAAAIAGLRLPPGARDTLWAEDAAVFLMQRLQLGPIASLVQPYDGYQHLVPRLIADVASALPAESSATTVTFLEQSGYVRYAAPASMFVVGLVVLAVERLVRAGRPASTVLAVVVLVGCVALLAVRAVPSDVARSGARTWGAEFRHGQQDCDRGAVDARMEQAPWGWGATLACTTIRDDTFPADPS